MLSESRKGYDSGNQKEKEDHNQEAKDHDQGRRPNPTIQILEG